MRGTYVTIDEFAACFQNKFLARILADAEIEANQPLTDPVNFRYNGEQYTVDLHTFNRCTEAIRPKTKAAQLSDVRHFAVASVQVRHSGTGESWRSLLILSAVPSGVAGCANSEPCGAMIPAKRGMLLELAALSYSEKHTTAIRPLLL